MKIAITAASGQLGRSIIKETAFKVGKENVIGIARTPAKVKDIGIEIRKGDYNNQSDFETALQDIDVLLLVSGNGAPDKRIGMHRNVIRGAKQAEVRKIIYSSIYGEESDSKFDDIIKSNRQTESDVQESGMDWIIGRNGFYIDADIESIPDYKKAGEISNCAGVGKCAYTSREELAYAYANLINNNSLNNQVFNLCGGGVTQQELTNVINEVFNENLNYKYMTFDEYLKDRIKAHDEFLGTVIAGIYQGIYKGVFNVPSDYKKICKREHLSLKQMVEKFKTKSR